MDLNPGDLFEWVYAYSEQQPVLLGERLYSTTMNKWVAIEDRLCLCVAIKGLNIY